MRRRGRPQPPNPGELGPSVPPVGNADGAPLRYGGLRAAPAPTKAYHIIYFVHNRTHLSGAEGGAYETQSIFIPIQLFYRLIIDTRNPSIIRPTSASIG